MTGGVNRTGSAGLDAFARRSSPVPGHQPGEDVRADRVEGDRLEVRRSSLAEVGDYVHADVEMGAFLPTSEENFATAVRNDALFWREEGPALVQRFNDWLSR
jgi:hypothetical protein